MKKRWVILSALILSMFLTNYLQGQELRVYNNGVIDYAPVTASFILEAEDDESTLMEIQYSIDGSPLMAYENPITFDTEGRHIIAYRAIDQTNNISREEIYSVIIDGTPPAGLATVDGPVYLDERYVYVNENSVIILWAEDQLSGVEAIYVRLDDGDFVAYTEPVSISIEGYHTAQVFALDNVGNKTETFVVEGYVDNTPPEVEILTEQDLVTVKGENYTNKENEFTVNAVDNISGARDVLVSLDGSPYVIYSGPFRVQMPGSHTLNAKAIDFLGNESYPVELNFYVDVTPPRTMLGTSVE